MGDFAFTEEEIRNELKKFGYDNVPTKKVVQFKKDLEAIIDQKGDVGARNSFDVNSEFSRKEFNSFVPTENIFDKPPKSNGIMKRKVLLSANSRTIASTPKRNELSSESASVSATSECSSCGGGKQIKRKVCRKTVDESLEDESTISETFSQLDMADWYTPRNTIYSKPVFLGAIPSGSSVIRSTSADSKQSSKCDPVRRYHEYKKFWDENAIPGEEKHRRLRWGVRERMCRYDPGLCKMSTQ